MPGKSLSEYVTEDDIAAMEAELLNLDKLDKEVLLAENAGLDMTEQKATLADHRKRANMFLATYRSKKR